MQEKKPINVEIGQNVKRLRENVGMTQESLAELLGLGVKHISAIEFGAAGVSIPTLMKLCSLLSVSADRILFGEPSSEQQDQRAAAMDLMLERFSHLPNKQFWDTADILNKILENVMTRS